MGRCGFLFDLIVVRVDVPNQTIEEPKELSVDAAFNNITLRITSSRINVVDFKPRRSFEFESTPEDLRRDLSVCPLKLTVYYNQTVLGTAIVPWADCVLDRINEAMGELTHIDECELVNEGAGEERVGSMEFICRLQCKCEEPSDDICSKSRASDIRKHLNRIIDPNDILFVVAEPNKEDVCNVPKTEDGEEPCPSNKPKTALDLSPYRILNGKLVQTTDTIDTCQNVDCCELMKTSQQYQKLIDALNPCKKKKANRKCQAFSHCDDCPHNQKFSSNSDTSSEASEGQFPCTCFAAQHQKDIMFGGKKVPRVKPCPPPIPMPDKMTHSFKTPRTCPVCNENLSWLPKLATCPKCGYKPVPVVVEKPYNEEMTAEQILQEYLDNRSSGGESESTKKTCEKRSECRCTCTKGKKCANCRVRSLCEDILEPQVEDESCTKCEEDTEEKYRLCATSSQDCRPHLARVFSELKDLFDATVPQAESEPYHEGCERQLNPPVVTATPRRSSAKSAAPQNGLAQQQLMPCMRPQPQKRRKRLRKRRGEGRKPRLSAAKAICRPPPCEPPIPAADDRLQKFHEACINRRKNVPSNMGWLWNAHPEFGRNWRPGAIRKPIKEIMRYFLRDFPADTIPISRYTYGRGRGKGDGRSDEEEEMIQQPTLHICKKNGEIFITLRPLKNPEALKNCANPYLNMKPIQFKIVKNPLATEIGKMKRCLKEMGFDKCRCHKPVVECFCRTFLDKKRLEYQIKKECRKRGLEEDMCDSLVLSDTSESEVEYDFGVTPPAGLIRPERARRPDKVNVGTQYEQCDWNLPPMNPKPPNIFMKWINCATGHKYAYRRASDLLTLGQKEALACKKKRLAEQAAKKAEKAEKGKKGKKGGKGRAKGGQEAAPPADPKEYMKVCDDGTKIDMRKYMDPRLAPKKRKMKSVI